MAIVWHRGAVACVAAVTASLAAQQAAPRFEVASVKRTADLTSERGGGFQPGGRFVLTNVDVRTLVRMAYRSGPVLFPSQIIDGDAWTGSERYDISATIGSELATAPMGELAQLQPPLLRALLEDRFRLKAHRETRTLPRYALVLARQDGRLGQRLRRSSADCSVDFSACATIARQGRYSSGGTTLSSLGNYLASSVVQQVVVDRTGLEGRFAIDLEWTPDQTPASDQPSIFTALQEQLGLKLESERGPVEVVVIDSVERPTPD